MQIGTHPVIIDVGIVALGHAQQDSMNSFHASCDDAELSLQLLRLVAAHRMLRFNDGSERRRRLGLDGDMYKNEPFLIDATQKILQQHDIA
jgi:hypothetical protein